MTSTPFRAWPRLAALGLALALAPAARAQDPAEKPKDDGLEKLLEKIDDPNKPKPGEPEKPAPKPAGSKDEGLDKLLDQVDARSKPDADAPKKPDALAPKDEGLDKLLEGLGQSKDKPAPEDQAGGGGGKPPEGDAKPGEAKPDKLGAGEKDLDDRLEELTGRKPRKKPGQGQGKEQGGGEGSGPMGDIIKEMREVEGRLGKPDTGEETRKKQSEIVKNLDQMIERMKNAPSQQQAMKMMRDGQQPKPGGPQPGQPGQQPGAMAGGAGLQKPDKPKTPPPLTDAAKELWGRLPDAFREGMGNAMHETALPARDDLVRLYFLSLGKKSAVRGE